VNGIPFTRTGRCQEREEVLGTTKPPYSLATTAALLRDRGVAVRVVDQTASQVTTDALIGQLEKENFHPTLVVFCSTFPTLQADVAEAARLKARFAAALVCFGPHASAAPAESMRHAPDVDAMIVGEPEEVVLALAQQPMADVPFVTFRRGAEILPHRAKATYASFPGMPFPAWDLLPIDKYRLPLVDESYVMVETSRGCPYTCDFCVAPIHQGHKFRERDAKTLVDEMERAVREFGVKFFYLWGDTVTLNARSFTQFCDELIARNLDVQWFANARADNLVDPAFVHRLRKAGCWMLSLGIESESDEVRRDMQKRLERQKIQTAFHNMRDAGIKSFAFFIYGHPGESFATMEQTTRFAVELDPDFANFYPAVPYPGTEMYEKCRRDGLLTEHEWSKLEYSYYVLSGNGLDEATVMGAIARARRQFFLRPRYIARRFGDVARLVMTRPGVVWQVLSHTLFNRRPQPATQQAEPQLASRTL
jgi:anaerobic magnesium-protoporphyrin IX monomethyl ester cyclase